MNGGNRIEKWLNTAVSGIRFKSDREAVEAELRGHLEDKVADLQRMYHLDREAAEEMALRQMGDAEEIGREMAKIHKPWWGYLWQASRVLVFAALAGLMLMWILVGFNTGQDPVFGAAPSYEWWDFDGYPGNAKMDGWLQGKARYELSKDPKQLMAKEVGQSVWINGQRIAMRHATIWRTEEGETLYLSLRLETPRFWERGELEEQWFNLTDNLGKEYDHAWTLVNFRGAGPFHQCVEVTLKNVDPAAEWVRLDYGLGEPLFSLTAELDREVEK